MRTIYKDFFRLVSCKTQLTAPIKVYKNFQIYQEIDKAYTIEKIENELEDSTIITDRFFIFKKVDNRWYRRKLCSLGGENNVQNILR